MPVAKEEYTVAWICARTPDYTLARAFLDEEYERPEHVTLREDSFYTFGKIGIHNEVIAVSPDKNDGGSSAAVAARHLASSFPNIRLFLMIGIGGGAPTAKHDIRLGDVVVGASGSKSGGVIQYDFGRTMRDQKFSITGILNRSPVNSHASNVLNSKIDGRYIQKAVRAVLKKSPKLKQIYRRPDANADRLYHPNAIHPQDDKTDCVTSCADNVLISRRERGEDEDSPKIHYGLIASSTQLVKDAVVRDKLAQEKEVLCFDLEASGLMENLPCLVIRGICDYSDTHKNSQWQDYAALTAAAYGRKVLERDALPGADPEMPLREPITDEDQDNSLLRAVVSDSKIKVEEREADFRLDHIRKWLLHSDPSTKFHKAREQHFDGTNQWFLDNDVYSKWKDEPPSFPLLNGIPRRGKTISSADLHSAKSLVKWGGYINAQGGYYGNALQAASGQGHEDIVQLLLRYGADPNAQGLFQVNALLAASVRSSIDIVQMLLDKGADVNAEVGIYGNTLRVASIATDKIIIQLLLKKGAYINPNRESYGALQSGSAKGHKTFVQLLLKKRADLDVQYSSNGSNALQAISIKDVQSIMQMRIDATHSDGQGREDNTGFRASSSQGRKNDLQTLERTDTHERIQDEQPNVEIPVNEMGDTSDLASVLSAIFSDISGQSSISSHNNAQMAVSHLVSLLVGDMELLQLLQIACSRAGYGRFARNLGRFLKAFGHALRAEACNELELQVANFIKISALRAAVELEERLTSKTSLADAAFQDNERSPNSSFHLNKWLQSQSNRSGGRFDDNPESDPEDNPDDLHSDQVSQPDSDDSVVLDPPPTTTLENVQEFLLSSTALSTLRNDIQQWISQGNQGNKPFEKASTPTVDPGSPQRIPASRRCTPVDEHSKESGKPSSNTSSVSSGIINMEQSVDDLQSRERDNMLMLLPKHIQQLILSIPTSNIWILDKQDASWLNRAKTCVEEKTQLRWNWWPMSPPKRKLQDDEARMFWRCSCGTTLWEEVSREQSRLLKDIISLPDRNHRETSCCATQPRIVGWGAYIIDMLQKSLLGSIYLAGSSIALRYMPPAESSSVVPVSSSTASAVAQCGEHSREPGPVRPQQHLDPPQDSLQSYTQNQKWILLGFQGPKTIMDTVEIDIDGSTTDHQFFEKLKSSYTKCRGKLRLWFSIWRLSHCEVVKFHRWTADLMVREYRDLPTRQDYLYNPRDKNPPISQHHFEALFYFTCDKTCKRVSPHRCIPPPIGTIVLDRIPKRNQSFRNDSTQEIWGLGAVHDVSFAYVSFYHCLILLGPFIFYVIWLRYFPQDLQNASVPITVVLGALSLFWSSCGILTSKNID